MRKDYYNILGIEKNASQDEIKRAFRKLAHKYHPDKEGGNEAKFKEANEAYQVLGNKEKRGQYDQFGATFDQQGGFGSGAGWEDFMKYARGANGGGGIKFDFGGLDLGDIFGDVFGFGGSRSRGQKQYRGGDIQIDVNLEFKEAVFGVKKEIELFKDTKCDHCRGNLAEPGAKISTCSTCNGQGQVQQVQRTFLGAIRTASTCPACQGQGKKAETPCSKCRGAGVVKQKEKIDMEIPAGIDNGATLRLTGKGQAGQYGGPAGDLYVNIRVKASRDFERRGNDVLVKKTISFKQAALGDKIEVKTLDGAVDLKIPAGTQPNTRFRLKDKGVPFLQNSGRGDMFVEVEVQVPKKLSRKQKKALEEFDE